MNRNYLYQDEPIVMILKPVNSLRSFNHEFTRFEKKALSMERCDKKNTHPASDIYLKIRTLYFQQHQ